jgi:acetoin utilization deacetylase AcuC-like enzyme
MKIDTLPVFFHADVLSMQAPDGLFERAPSPLLEHQVPFAECPQRIANIKSVLERGPSAARFSWHAGRHASDEEILRFHTAGYLARLQSWDRSGHWATATTYLPKAGLAGVRAGAGTTLAALSHILDGDTSRAYALVRPPSHHAAPAVADGYCLLNAVGMAVETARAQGCARVAVVDWDVHHGNGTQSGFYARDDVLCISMHMNHGAWGESHPESGDVDEVGAGAGRGYNLNLPLPPGVGDATYSEVVNSIVIPALERFQPELIVVSNGHDAGQFDPNGRQSVTMAGFHQMALQLSAAAEQLCGGRLLIVQEGGYNVAYVGFCAYASALGFLGRPLDLDDPLAFYPEDLSMSKQAVAALAERHPLLNSERVWQPEGIDRR